MKKVLSIAAVAALVAAAVSISVYVNGGRNEMDDLFYANIEALARSEGGGFGAMCSQTGTPGNYRMKDCSNCSGSMGSYAMDKVAYCQN